MHRSTKTKSSSKSPFSAEKRKTLSANDEVGHSCAVKHLHPDHRGQLSRLNRIIGQLEGIRRMVEERRYCPQILLQTSAVKAAVRSFESTILDAHLRHCVTQAMSLKSPKERDQKILELLELFDRRS